MRFYRFYLGFFLGAFFYSANAGSLTGPVDIRAPHSILDSSVQTHTLESVLNHEGYYSPAFQPRISNNGYSYPLFISVIRTIVPVPLIFFKIWLKDIAVSLAGKLTNYVNDASRFFEVNSLFYRGIASSVSTTPEIAPIEQGLGQLSKGTERKEGVDVVLPIIIDLLLNQAPDSSDNKTPIANAGDSQTVSVNEKVFLDGGDSFDPDSGNLSYEWAFIGKPIGTEAVLTDPLKVSSSFVPDVAGLYTVSLIVHDGQNFSEYDILQVTVAPENNTPTIQSTPIESAATHVEYNYKINAQDADGDILSFSLAIAPRGMSINDQGLISWFPEQTGSFGVSAYVSDNKGGIVNTTFYINVSNPNFEPQITSSPPLSALVDSVYVYSVAVNDINRDSITYQLESAPAGMFISETGLIYWLPNEAVSADVIVKVSDQRGGTDKQSFSIKVEDKFSQNSNGDSNNNSSDSDSGNSSQQPRVYVGGTSGDFQVSQGTAYYTIPIKVSAGRGGMQPGLSLAHNGSEDSGIIGVGWNLDGVSAISRCPSNLAQDGFIRGIDFSSTDRYCLDGQRLVPINGENGGVGTEYRTEVDIYSRIVSVGGSTNNPDYFSVHTKAGHVISYGRGHDSALNLAKGRYSWSVSEINDTTGKNPITYRYNIVENKQLINSITYAGGKINFGYELRSQFDRNAIFIAGSKVVTQFRLNSIKSYHKNQLLRDYRLTYGKELDKTLLVGFQECSGTRNNCLQPVDFEWYQAEDSFNNIIDNNPIKQADLTSLGWKFVDFYDTNGDGLKDAVWVYSNIDNTGTKTAVSLAKHDGSFGSRVTSTLTSKGSYAAKGWKFAGMHDSNGDGLPDATWVYSDDTETRVDVSLARLELGHGRYGPIKSTTPAQNGKSGVQGWEFSGMRDTNADGFADAIWVYYDTSDTGSKIAVALAKGDGAFGDMILSTPSETGKYRASGWKYKGIFDINGDLLPDAVWVHSGTSNSGRRVAVSLASGDGIYGDIITSIPTNTGRYEANGWAYRGMHDTNGDGLPDAIWAYSAATSTGAKIAISLNKGQGEFSRTMIHSTVKDHGRYAALGWLFGGMHDVNADGLVDATWVYAHSSDADKKVSVSLAQGDGTYGDMIDNEPSIWGSHNSKGSGWRFSGFHDVNGDLRPDAVWTYSNNQNVGTRTLVSFSQGRGLFGPLHYSSPNNIGAYQATGWETQPRIFDINGDALADVIWMRVGQVNNGVDISVSTSGSAKPRLKNIKDSYGNTTTISYLHLSEPSVYKSTRGGATYPGVYPVKSIRPPQTVVSSVIAEDGVGGLATILYKYEDLKTNLWGRGSLGFGRIIETYPETNKSVKLWFDRRGFPFTGKVSFRAEFYKEALLNSSVHRYESTSHYPGVESVHLAYSRDKSFELDRKLSSMVTIYNSDIDLYGNIGSSFHIYQDQDLHRPYVGGSGTFRKYFSNVFENDVGQWRLGRLIESSVRHVSPTDDQIRKISRFSYNNDTGLLKSESVIGSQSKKTFQTVLYEHDEYGQQIRSTSKVPGHADRVESVERDTLGRPIKSCDALNQCNTYQYNEYGQLVLQADINKVELRSIYDDFQRKRLEIRADGSYSSSNFYFAESSLCGDLVEHAYYCAITEVSGAPQIIVQYDSLGREVRKITSILTEEAKSYQDTVYNQFGEVSRISRPYFKGEYIYWTENKYDALNRLVELVESGPHGSKIKVKNVYDGLTTTSYNGPKQLKTKVTKNVQGKTVSVEEEGIETSYTYSADDLLRTTTIGGQISTRIQLKYDERRRKISTNDPDTGLSNYEYDGYGRLISETDAKGQVVSMEYDALDRLIRRVEPEGASYWEYGGPSAPHGSIGKLLVEKDGNTKMAYEYDEIGRIFSKTYELEGRSYTEETHYDHIGRIAKIDYPGEHNFFIENIYNELGLLQAVRGNRIQTQTYDLEKLAPLILDAVDLAEKYASRAQKLREIGSQYQSKLEFYKQLVDSNDPSMPKPDADLVNDLRIHKSILESQIENAQALSPEFLGHLNDAIIELENVTKLLSNQVDDYAKLVEKITTLAEQTLAAADQRFQYERNLIEGAKSYKELISEKGYTIYWQVTNVDASGRITAEVYGNGVTNQYRYDPATGQLTASDSRLLSFRPMRHLEYQYDAYDNVILRHDLVNDIRESFVYDRLDRLTLSQLSSDRHYGEDQTITQEQRYDDLGNITYKSDVGYYEYDSKKIHAVIRAGENRYKYDANGNMTEGGGRSYIWNSFNKPLRMTRGDKAVGFSYGVDRNRYKKVSSDGATTWYVGGLYEQKNSNNGQTKKHQYSIYAAGNLVAFHNVSGDDVAKTSYLHKDSLGSIDTISDDNAEVVERRNYDAWGKQRYFNFKDGGVLLPHFDPLSLTTKAYTGHETVDEVGLIHMNGRVYDALLARFISADPFVQAPEMSQSYNRYSYVKNNPMKYTDPSGYFFKKVFRAIKKAFRKVIKAVKPFVGVIVAAAITVACGGTCGPIVATALAGASAGAASAAVNGGNILKAAAIGGISGAIFGGIGISDLGNFAKAGAHAVAGGTLSVVQGGKFGEGFLSAGFAKFATIRLTNEGVFNMSNRSVRSIAGRTFVAASVGGSASVIGGGKFANGARTAAFAHLLNAESSFRGSHYARNSENDNYLKKLKFFGRDDITLDEIDTAGRFGFKRATNAENRYHQNGLGNDNNIKFTSRVANPESFWQRNYSNRYGRYELIVRPNLDGTFTHVTDPLNMGTLNYGTNPSTHTTRDWAPYKLFGNAP